MVNAISYYVHWYLQIYGQLLYNLLTSSLTLSILATGFMCAWTWILLLSKMTEYLSLSLSLSLSENLRNVFICYTVTSSAIRSNILVHGFESRLYPKPILFYYFTWQCRRWVGPFSLSCTQRWPYKPFIHSSRVHRINANIYRRCQRERERERPDSAFQVINNKIVGVPRVKHPSFVRSKILTPTDRQMW